MVTLLVLKALPSLVGAKLRVARTPSPAGRLAPDIEKPITIPVAELNCASSSDEALVKSTPSVSNWKPPILKLELYKTSAV